ncbi:hypothetical protein BAR24_09385 [Gluconobacter oxydans]|uniref:hypothetical protein n=1 Tax=Gluconobacter thailandicus TaxID=257438 RepID=UPI00029993C5|nr:hypothetical protein [Gluconobacter thailandicus]AFW02933.1 hypothetical protein B932_3388 [Gluconobacter oxydans H24]ANQ41653.1 hypothetical protein BAR24_09385 [Gluconobacter oxydans]
MTAKDTQDTISKSANKSRASLGNPWQDWHINLRSGMTVRDLNLRLQAVLFTAEHYRHCRPYWTRTFGAERPLGYEPDAEEETMLIRADRARRYRQTTVTTYLRLQYLHAQLAQAVGPGRSQSASQQARLNFLNERMSRLQDMTGRIGASDPFDFAALHRGLKPRRLRPARLTPREMTFIDYEERRRTLLLAGVYIIGQAVHVAARLIVHHGDTIDVSWNLLAHLFSEAIEPGSRRSLSHYLMDQTSVQIRNDLEEFITVTYPPSGAPPKKTPQGGKGSWSRTVFMDLKKYYEPLAPVLGAMHLLACHRTEPARPNTGQWPSVIPPESGAPSLMRGGYTLLEDPEDEDMTYATIGHTLALEQILTSQPPMICSKKTPPLLTREALISLNGDFQSSALSNDTGMRFRDNSISVFHDPFSNKNYHVKDPSSPYKSEIDSYEYDENQPFHIPEYIPQPSEPDDLETLPGRECSADNQGPNPETDGAASVSDDHDRRFLSARIPLRLPPLPENVLAAALAYQDSNKKN